MQLKKILALLITLLLILTFSACGSKSVNDSGANTGAEETAPVKTEEPSSTPTEEPLPSVELIVFAAASMTDAMNGIATMYADVAPNVTFKFNFDSSGTLKTQIQEGADCDIFISASQKAMNQLDINADSAVNTEGLDFVVSDSRITLYQIFVSLPYLRAIPQELAPLRMLQPRR
jgi:molybdate transport system substrate-binding protein